MLAALAAAFVAALLSLGGASLVIAGEPQGNGNGNGNAYGNANGNANGHVDQGNQTPATAPAPADTGGGGKTSPPPAKAHGKGDRHETKAHPQPGGRSTGKAPKAQRSPSPTGKSDNGAPKGKVTICHATGSATNPFVEITISVNGLHGHGKHADDIIPAPDGGCPRGTAASTRAEKPEHHKGKITICHATGSATNPFVEITISVNGLHGHGKHADDIIPAPDAGCPQGTAASTRSQRPTVKRLVTPVTENTILPAQAVLAATAQAPGRQAVLGVRASAGTAPATAPAGASEVLGAQGGAPPASATAPASATEPVTGKAAGRSLPFTGTDAMLVLLLGCVTLLGGVALQRLSSRRS